MLTSTLLLRLLPYTLVAVASPVLNHHNGHGHDQIIVDTTSGRFIPTFTDAHPDVASFLDIPYGENPTGNLRFAAPVPVKNTNSTPVQATSLPAACFQYIPPAFQGTLATDGLPAFNLQYGDFSNTTEDCLHLSVFAPKTAVITGTSDDDDGCDDGESSEEEEPLPVLVWIHGGGYQFGGINVPYQLPQPWVQKSQKHIVVAVQYRLGLLGLPNAAGMIGNVNRGEPDDINSSINLFLLDQLLAVRWVHDNIARFGGDPSRITLWGQSAGGYSVDSLPFISPSPHVSGVIAESGNAIGMGATSIPKGSNTDHSLFSTAAASLGCGAGSARSSLAAEEELACMRAVSSQALKTYIQDGGAQADNMTFAGVVDDLTIFGDYASIIKSSSSNNRTNLPPLLIGSTTDEGNAVVPYDFPGSQNATKLPTTLAAISNQFTTGVTCYTRTDVTVRTLAKTTTYQYLYAGNFTNNLSPRPWLGAYHTSEIPLIFGTAGTLGDGANTPFQDALAQRMQDMWFAFARDPEQGLRRMEWVPASSSAEEDGKGEPKIMKFGGADGVVARLIGNEEFGQDC